MHYSDTVFSLISANPFIIAKYKELKKKLEVFRETNEKKTEKEAKF